MTVIKRQAVDLDDPELMTDVDTYVRETENADGSSEKDSN